MASSHRIVCDDNDDAGDGMVSHAAVTSPYSVASPLTKSDADVAFFPFSIPLKSGMLREEVDNDPCKVEKSDGSRVKNLLPAKFQSATDVDKKTMLDSAKIDTGNTGSTENPIRTAERFDREDAVGHVRSSDKADVPPKMRVAESLRSTTLHSRIIPRSSVEVGRTVREIATDIKRKDTKSPSERPLDLTEKARGPVSSNDDPQNDSFEDDRILFEEKIHSLQQLVESQSRSVWELRDLTASLRLGNDQSSTCFYILRTTLSNCRILLNSKACNV